MDETSALQSKGVITREGNTDEATPPLGMSAQTLPKTRMLIELSVKGALAAAGSLNQNYGPGGWGGGVEENAKCGKLLDRAWGL